MKTKVTLKLRKKLVATWHYDKREARKGMDVSYYVAQGLNQKTHEKILKEKGRLSVPRSPRITEILNKFRQEGESKESVTGKILHKIFEKNKAMVKGQVPFQKTTNILPIIARPETLLLAYKRLKGNKGAMAKAAFMNSERYRTLSPLQQSLYKKALRFPDGFNYKDIELTGYLVLKGQYPWGTSRRIWLKKPGDKQKMRPITIPPFLDRIVQEAIKMVLLAIWEPEFETINRSFGFRPNKSSHDAITALTCGISQGLFMAIEGDIQGAYDNVNKNTLLAQLESKIQDKKFIKFMKRRLYYDYKDGKSVHNPTMGIPQGGIDSPYLFNIYLSQLDKFVQKDLSDYLKGLNAVKGIKENESGKINVVRRRRMRNLDSMVSACRKTKVAMKDPQIKIDQLLELRQKLYEHVKNIRLERHRLRNMPSFDPNRRRLRLHYVRYADDWIILSNVDASQAAKLKGMIKDFLSDKLEAILSEPKTLITDIRKESAHFLGFEIQRASKGRRIYLRKGGKTMLFYSPGLPVNTSPDRQRLINRMYMRGYCTRKGMPKSIPWLSVLDANVIIERFNSILMGLSQYYLEWISEPSKINRWIYILRYSCLKTLAQKYNTSIMKIFRRFGIHLNNASRRTVQVKVVIKVGGKSYEKLWTLLTYKDLMNMYLPKKTPEKLSEVFWEREQGKIGGYPPDARVPVVTNENFLDSARWVSARSRAIFDMPCSYCGNTEEVEMHHETHIRKIAYVKIPANRTYQQMMNLRNRKQIPLCRSCHMDLVHGGSYSGPRIGSLANVSDKLVDNRVLHVESYVKPGREYFAKTLPEKGWAEAPNSPNDSGLEEGRPKKYETD